MFFAIPAAMTAIGAGMDIYGAIQGAQQAKQAEADLQKFVAERDKLQYTDRMQALQVGQRGEDLASANLAQQGGQMLNTLQDAGSAALIGGVGALAQNMSDQNLQIGANLSERAYANEALKARNAQMVENLNTQYKMGNVQQDIMGAQSAYAQGMNQKWAGLSSAAGAAAGLANSYLEYSDLYKDEDTGDATGRGSKRAEKSAAKAAATIGPDNVGPMYNYGPAEKGVRGFNNQFGFQPFGLTTQNFGAPGMGTFEWNNARYQGQIDANNYYNAQMANYANPFLVEYGTIKKP